MRGVNRYVLARALEQEAARPGRRIPVAEGLRRMAQALIEYPTSTVRLPEALGLLGLTPADVADPPPSASVRPSVKASVRSLQEATEALEQYWSSDTLRQTVMLRKLRRAAATLITALSQESEELYNKRIIDNNGRVAGIISTQGDDRRGRPLRSVILFQTQDSNSEAKQ